MAIRDLSALARQAAELETSERRLVGVSNSFIKLLSDPMSKELQEGKPDFIPGAKYKGYVCSKSKVALGTAPIVTVLGVFKLYEDTLKRPEGSKEIPKIVRYFMPQDAEQVEVEGMFNRPYTDKEGVEHILSPIHWVFLYFHKHPEITDAVYGFRSTGNAIVKELQKIIAQNSETCTELRFKMGNQAIDNKTYNNTRLYPAFTLVGNNFKLDDGELSEVEGGFDEDELKKVLERSVAVHADYKANKLVALQGNMAALMAPRGKAIPAPRAAAAIESDTDDEEMAKPVKTPAKKLVPATVVEDDDDEEEAPPPVKRPAVKKVAKPVVEDDDDDADDDDDDDDAGDVKF
jgi:hypothetical protein